MGIEPYWRRAVEDVGIDVFFRGDMRLVPRCDAVKFAQWIVNDKRILGFEGFLFDGESVRLLMECIADFSDLSKSKNGLEITLKVLAEPEFQKPTFIEFVLED